MPRWVNTSDHYGRLAKLFHWCLGFSILCMIIAGWTMDLLPRDHAFRPGLYFMHKSTGILILPLAIAWMISWIAQIKPMPPKNQRKSLNRFSRLIHGVLLVCVIGMPLSGWAMVSGYTGAGVSVYGLVTVPSLTSVADPDFGRAMKGLHILLSWILAGSIGIHIAAALYHHFVKKDMVLRRMMPFMRPLKTIRGKTTKKTSNVHHLR